MPPRGESAEPRRQAACHAVGSIDPVHLEDGRLLEGEFGSVILRLPDGTYRSYSGGLGGDSVFTFLARDPTINRNFEQGPTKKLGFSIWSLTAALTPGGHHVRLYLETEGKITTMISEKDNFVRFHSESSPRFLDLSTSQPLDVRPRDPNVSQNEAGVYVMTWDNRDPSVGPGSPSDTDYVSPNFGLAFSVDGLNWTVYSNELVIDGLQRTIGTSESRYCTSSIIATSGIRHVVPVFLTNDQIRLYFSNKIITLGSGTCSKPSSCSLGTAISN